MSILQLWGKELQDYRKNAGFTQGQLIDQLSLLVNDLSDNDQQVLENIGVYEEATTYFGGILDAPTLSRLEKGTRTLKSRPRCVALLWGLVQLDAMRTVEEANQFLELGGHGNLTNAESTAIFASDQPVDHEVKKEEVEGQIDELRSDIVSDSEHYANSGGPRNRWVAVGAIGLLIVALGIGYLLSPRPKLELSPQGTNNVVEVAANNPANDALDNANTNAPDNAADDAKAIAQPDNKTAHTLLAESLTTQFGEIGKDQTYVNLHELDQVGSSDEWLRHVKFIPTDAPYRGYRSYFVPAYVYKSFYPPSVTAIRIETNYRGRGIDGQVWTWRLFDWVEQGWVTVGDNSDAHWWGDWQTLPFDASGTLVDYINPDTGEIRLEVQANDMSDSMDLDYEAIIVTVD